jgi:hypothetical protein
LRQIVDGANGIPLGEPRLAAAEVGRCIVAFELDGFGEVGNRLLVVGLFREGGAADAVGLGA